MLANLNTVIATISLFCMVSSSMGLIPQCGSNINCCQTAVTLRNAGFSGSRLNTMTAIAYYESTWGTRKGPNTNRDGSTDNGLFQVNSYVWCSASGRQNDCCCPGTSPRCRSNATLRTCSCGCGTSCSQALTNDASNTQCASTILSRQGYIAWAAYNSHVTECNSYNMFNGRCSSGSCCSALYPGSVCCPQVDPNAQACCPSTHSLCCPAPHQNKCCPLGYPVCCGTHCCPAGSYCCGTNQCCRQNSRSDKLFTPAISKAASVAEPLI